jgi:hypothetical protein
MCLNKLSDLAFLWNLKFELNGEAAIGEQVLNYPKNNFIKD